MPHPGIPHFLALASTKCQGDRITGGGTRRDDRHVDVDGAILLPEEAAKRFYGSAEHRGRKKRITPAVRKNAHGGSPKPDTW
jgi:hypothetical protein